MDRNSVRPERAPPRRRMLASLVFAALAVGLLTPAMSFVGTPPRASAAEHAPARLAEFLWALAGQESGWRYDAENPSSGAYGKYQVMPFNWPNWSRDYIGDPHAPQTAVNQEIVAAGKVIDLHRWLRRYDRVAYWWLSGLRDPDKSNWSSYARNYVANVMSLMGRAPAGGDGPTPTGPNTGLERGDVLRTDRSFRLRAGPSWPSATLVRVPRHSELTVLRSKWVPINGQPRAWVRLEAPDGTRGWVRYRILAARIRG